MKQQGYLGTCDLVQEDDEIWIYIGRGTWGVRMFERLEVVRAEGYRVPRGVTPAAGFAGESGSRDSGARTGRFHREPESKYGIRDHRAMNQDVTDTMLSWLAQYDAVNPNADILKNLRNI